jgi:hypothetical protein
LSLKEFTYICDHFLSIYLEEKLLEDILNEFKPNEVECICVASEKSPTTAKSHLHIQIILKNLMNKYGFFLDKCTDRSHRIVYSGYLLIAYTYELGVHCNYQITKNNLAYTEVQCDQGRFSTSASLPGDVNNLATTSAKRTTVRAQAEERRQKKNKIADTALTCAETNVSKAMVYIREQLLYEFMQHCDKLVDNLSSFHIFIIKKLHIHSFLIISSFHKSFNYVHKQAKERQQYL